MKRMVLFLFVILSTISMVSAQTHWAGYTEGPVLEPSAGRWDYNAVINGGILDYQDTLRMWYHAYPNNNIGYAWSLDGINWTKFAGNPVMIRRPGTWEQGQIARPIVLPVDGEFIMMYQGWNNVNDRTQIGIAYAPAPWGPWTREASNPVIASTDFTGCLGIYIIGFEYEYDSYHAWLSWTEDWLTYHYCHATSDSLKSWSIDPNELITSSGPESIFEARLDEGGCTIKVDDTRYLIYRGTITGDETWYHGLATSTSDSPYEHSIWNPVIGEEPAGFWFHEDGWGYPYTIYDPQSQLFRMWFTSFMNNTNNAGIGYAASLPGYRGLDTLDVEDAFIRVRYEGDPEISLFARFYSDGSLLDSVELYDDGVHQDLQATDSIFGCALPALVDEDYSITIAGYQDTNMIIEYLEVDSGTVVGIETANSTMPSWFELEQNYPNPFNPVSTLRYDLPHGSNVSLIVYDILGREVARLADGTMEPGYHEVQWNGREFASGIYIARLVTPEYSKSIKMLLLK